MNNELQSLNERIAERIGKDLIELIPQDQWQRIVDAEITKFTKETAPKIIRDLLTEAYKEAAKKEISKFTTQDEWSQLTNSFTNKALKELLSASGGEIFAGVLHPAMQYVMQDLRNRLGY